MSSYPLLSQSRSWLESSPCQKPLPTRLAVGWSGGADSTALLLALKSRGYDVHAWHVDHGWHARSADDAQLLAGWAEQWGVPYDSVRLDGATENNREAQARAGRYAAFQELSQASGITALALAHHRNDQAETVFMRMLQGAGVHGMRGMHPVRQRQDLTIFRPFLHLARHQLVEALQQADVMWLEDASNSDTSLWRNRLRHRTFPAMVESGIDPVELFMRWQQQAVNIADRIDTQLLDVELSDDVGGCSLPWSVWCDLAPVMRVYLLQQMMQRLFGEGVVAGRRHIELMETWMAQGGVGGLDLSRSRLMRKDGRLRLAGKGLVAHVDKT